MARVVICFRAPTGGLFRHVRDLVRFISQNRVKVGMVFDSGYIDESLESHINAIKSHCSLGIMRVPIPRGPGFWDIPSLIALIRFCRDCGAQLIHGHGAKGGLYARLAGRLLRIPVCYTPHGGSLHFKKTNMSGRLYLWAEKCLLNFTEGIIFESKYALETFQKTISCQSCKSTINYNGLNDGDYLPRLNDPRYNFVFVGHLRKLKGVDTLLEAIRKVSDNGRSVKVAIFGLGPEEEKLKKMSADLGLNKSVSWHGQAPSGRYAMERADCVVVPSLLESFPYVVLEAASMRAPLIATNVGGIPEIFGKELSKFLVTPADPESLACAMTQFLSNRKPLMDMAEKLQKRVRAKFRVEHMGKKVLQFYRSVGCRI
jgi:glycosyltransferase involved in cell wall biosynthesis